MPLSIYLRERWTGWRNRVLMSARFQRLATKAWPLRPVARRRARGLFDLVAGFTYSQTLFACVELQLFDLLAEPQTTRAVAAATGLPEAGANRLLKAATALRLAESLGDSRWTLGAEGAALRGNPGIAEMVAHHRLLYADLADPVALLRRGGGGGALASMWTYAGAAGQGDAEAVAAYSRLMAASQPIVAAQVLDAYPFARHRAMLDVGGGEGRFAASVAARVPALRIGVLDLPSVGERARRFLDSAGCGAVSVHGGDFLIDALPPGYDLITLVRVLHDHDDDAAMRLLRGIHAALPQGGRVVVAEPMAGVRGAEPMGDAYFGLYLLAMGSGRPRTADEIAAMLRAAGFAAPRCHATAMPLTVTAISAVKAN